MEKSLTFCGLYFKCPKLADFDRMHPNNIEIDLYENYLYDYIYKTIFLLSNGISNYFESTCFNLLCLNTYIYKTK